MSSKYAILIGINGYHESLGRLKYCVNDVRRLADVLTQGDDAFPKDRLLVLTDDGDKDKCPTYANIHSWLASYLAQAEDDDTVFVYFAGHGREQGGKAYLLPCDATLQTVHVTGIPVSYLQELLDRCKARQKVLVLDACHSGAGRDVAAMSTGMLSELSGSKGIYTITSCDAAELSHEWGEKKHGVFSYFLSEGLAGGCAPDGRNRVTGEALYEWVYDRVRSWAREHRCTQTPKRFAAGTGSVVLRLAQTTSARDCTGCDQDAAVGSQPELETKARSDQDDVPVAVENTGAQSWSEWKKNGLLGEGWFGLWVAAFAAPLLIGPALAGFFKAGTGVGFLSVVLPWILFASLYWYVRDLEKNRYWLSRASVLANAKHIHDALGCLLNIKKDYGIDRGTAFVLATQVANAFRQCSDESAANSADALAQKWRPK